MSIPASSLRRACGGAIILLLAGSAARADIYVADPMGLAVYHMADDGAGTARFAREVGHPTGLALDSAGSLYVADRYKGKIYKCSAHGDATVVAEDLATPFGLAFDRAGALYVAAVDEESKKGSVVKITPAGVRSTFVEGLKFIRGLAFDRAGNLYVAEFDTNTIYKVAADGSRSVFTSNVKEPVGIAFDAAGNLFVCGQRSSVFKVNPAGEVSVFTSNVIDPRWLAFDAAGNLFVTDVGDATGMAGHGKVYRFDPAGERTLIDNTLEFPTGLVIVRVADSPWPEAASEADAGKDSKIAPVETSTGKVKPTP